MTDQVDCRCALQYCNVRNVQYSITMYAMCSTVLQCAVQYCNVRNNVFFAKLVEYIYVGKHLSYTCSRSRGQDPTCIN